MLLYAAVLTFLPASPSSLEAATPKGALQTVSLTLLKVT